MIDTITTTTTTTSTVGTANNVPVCKYRQGRIQELEAELARYHEIMMLDNRTDLIEKMMLVGEQLGYRHILSIPEIKPGQEAWRDFIDRAYEDELAHALAIAQHYHENLLALGMIAASTSKSNNT